MEASILGTRLSKALGHSLSVERDEDMLRRVRAVWVVRVFCVLGWRTGGGGEGS